MVFRRYKVTLSDPSDLDADSMPAEILTTDAVTRSRRWHQRLDWLGAWASFVCALHCAALPILIGVAPFIGAQWFASHAFDEWAVSIALVFGAAVIGAAYCTHRWRRTLFLYLASALLLIVGGFFVHAPALLHGSLLCVGGVLLAVTHLVNRRSANRHGCTRNLWMQLLGLD